MLPIRSRNTDTAKMNELEATVAGLELKSKERSSVRTVTPQAYFMSSPIGDIFGKYIQTMEGKIADAYVMCERSEIGKVPKVTISLSRPGELISFETPTTILPSAVDIPESFKVKRGDTLIIESPTPDLIKCISLTFNIISKG